MRISYSPQALDAIRQAAIQAFLSMPHRGVEVGGILYGSRGRDGITVLDSRPLILGHTHGPSFSPGEENTQELRRLLSLPLHDPSMAGMEVVGWYRSKTRQELELTPQDLEFSQRLLPASPQLILLLRPTAFGATRAAFFARLPDGSIEPKPGEAGFEIPPSEKSPAHPVKAPPFKLTIPSISISVPRISPRVPPITIPHRLRKPLVGAALLLAVMLAMVSLLPSRKPNLNPVHRTLGLMATNDGQALRISWAPHPDVLKAASGGLLRIREGDEDTDAVMLDQPGLPKGSIVYTPRSSFVRVNLKLYRPDGPALEESLFYLAPDKPLESAQLSATPSPKH